VWVEGHIRENTRGRRLKLIGGDSKGEKTSVWRKKKRVPYWGVVGRVAVEEEAGGKRLAATRRNSRGTVETPAYAIRRKSAKIFELQVNRQQNKRGIENQKSGEKREKFPSYITIG